MEVIIKISPEEIKTAKEQLSNLIDTKNGIIQATHHSDCAIRLQRGIMNEMIEACEHDWKYTGTGRHGSDKGDDFYRCRVCDTGKTE